MDNNLYPNDGQYYQPSYVKEKDTKETDEIEKNFDILQDILDHLQARIDHFGSPESIQPLEKETPEQFMVRALTNRGVRDTLIAERSAIENLINTFKKK